MNMLCEPLRSESHRHQNTGLDRNRGLEIKDLRQIQNLRVA